MAGEGGVGCVYMVGGTKTDAFFIFLAFVRPWIFEKRPWFACVGTHTLSLQLGMPLFLCIFSVVVNGMYENANKYRETQEAESRRRFSGTCAMASYHGKHCKQKHARTESKRSKKATKTAFVRVERSSVQLREKTSRMVSTKKLGVVHRDTPTTTSALCPRTLVGAGACCNERVRTFE